MNGPERFTACEAAQLSADPAFANYLRLRAEALLSDDYFKSDIAWLELKNPKVDLIFAASAPYMLWFHQRPTGGGAWPGAHLHAHVAPLWRAPGVVRHVAAGELGSGVFFNPVVPEEAAARLRDQPGTR